MFVIYGKYDNFVINIGVFYKLSLVTNISQETRNRHIINTCVISANERKKQILTLNHSRTKNINKQNRHTHTHTQNNKKNIDKLTHSLYEKIYQKNTLYKQNNKKKSLFLFTYYFILVFFSFPFFLSFM